MKSINTGNLPAEQWSTTLGAFGLPGAGLTVASLAGGMLPGGSLPVSAAAISPRGAAMSVDSDGTCVASLRRFRPGGIAAPVNPAAVCKQEAHNQYAPSVDVDGVGASGPPRERETA